MINDPLRQACEDAIRKDKRLSLWIPTGAKYLHSLLVDALLAFAKAQRREALEEEAAYWREKCGLLTMAVVERCEQRIKELK